MSQSRLLVSLILLILFLLPLDSAEAQQNPGVEYLRYNVDITLEESGDFRVRETQKVWYGGEFSEGFAEIPLDYLNDITDITVYGGLDEDNLSPYEFDGYGPDTFSLEKEGDTLYVDWEYEPTSWGDELTFEIEYVVDGGLWIYPDADYLEWRAVPADRSGLEIPESQITINLPFSQGQEDVVFEAIGPEFSAVSRTQDDGQQIIFTADEPLPDGIAFQIMVEFPHGLIGAAPQTWQITEDEAELVYRIPSIDIEMSLDEAGNLHISEHQNVQVVEGMMYEGFRRFTWLFLEGLDKLYVYEGDVYYDFVDGVEPLVCEDCFTLSMDNRYSTWVTYDRTNDEIDINDYAAGSGEVTWRFSPLVKGEETIFDLEYDAFGTVSINEEDQKLHWTVLPGYDVPVEIATVHLSLPNRLGLEDVTIEGANSAQSANGEILLTLDAPATDWAIQVTMPPGTTSADKPSWQLEFEGVYAEAEAYRQRLAREKVMFGAGGLAVLVIGLLGGLAAWYLRGSQKWREMRGNYRTIPPSDLAPGLVAYLIDEKATAKGALASLLHLATLGLVRLELGNTLQLERISKEDRLSENEKLKSPAGQTIQVEPHIVFLYNSLVGVLPLNSPVTFDSFGMCQRL